jgi:hypothetical protein
MGVMTNSSPLRKLRLLAMLTPIVRFPLSGADAETVLERPASVHALTVSDRTLYWIEGTGDLYAFAM